MSMACGATAWRRAYGWSRRRRISDRLDTANKFLYGDVGLSQNAAQGSDCKLSVDRNDAASSPLPDLCLRRTTWLPSLA